MKLTPINFNEISNYKDPFTLFSDWGVTMVTDGKKVNPMTIGWGSLGILWSKPCCTVYIHEVRYSRHMFDSADKFAVCFLNPDEYKEEMKYFGTASGKDEDKATKTKLTVLYKDGIPYFEESDLVIFCTKMSQSKFDPTEKFPERIQKWYDKDGVHSLYYGEITEILMKK